MRNRMSFTAKHVPHRIANLKYVLAYTVYSAYSARIVNNIEDMYIANTVYQRRSKGSEIHKLASQTRCVHLLFEV